MKAKKLSRKDGAEGFQTKKKNALPRSRRGRLKKRKAGRSRRKKAAKKRKPPFLRRREKKISPGGKTRAPKRKRS